jgi:primase-polymerase (primpol)-like protein
MIDGKRWVRWKYIDQNGKPSKLPVRLDGSCASSIAPVTWCTYQQASKSTIGNGLGLVLLESDSVWCVDVDNCLDANGQATGIAKRILDLFGDTYCEVSPSGKGLHFFFSGSCPSAFCHHGIEVYGSKRFICMTGNTFTKHKSLRNVDCSEFLNTLFA